MTGRKATRSDRMRGVTAFYAGKAAEDGVAETYRRRGLAIAHHRWRGQAGEIDLIARDGDALVFVEVKRSRSHARAAESLSPTQMQRIFSAAEEYLAGEPSGQLTDIRFDVALVDGIGKIEILENALAA